MRAIIVEDEGLAREVLQNYLITYCPEVQIIGQAENIHQAVPLIFKEKPDLVFLDIEMPFGNGFDVLEACQELHFETIFITAYSEYAIKALNMSAAYYLLKPLSIEELVVAVNKVKETISQKNSFNRNDILLKNLKETSKEKTQLILPTTEGFDVVKIGDIIRLQANGNFTDIYLSDGKMKMVCRFLKYFEELLPDFFLRVHKSHIVNSQCVVAYHKGMGGYILLVDNTEIDISLTYKENFIQFFNSKTI